MGYSFNGLVFVIGYTGVFSGASACNPRVMWKVYFWRSRYIPRLCVLAEKNEKDNSFRQSSFVDILVDACLLDA